MITLLRNIWNTPDLRSKILFTLLIIAMYRVLSFVPMPGVNVSQLRSLFEQDQFLNLLSLFSGGSLGNFSILTLGLSPYISASIIVQLLTMVFPRLEELSKEGASGQRKINQYTRFLTIPLAVIQGIGVFAYLNSQGLLSSLGYVHIVLLILSMTAGTMLTVWLGELITEKGVGNGVSLLIFAGILAKLPVTIGSAVQTQTSGSSLPFIVIGVLAVLLVAGVVFITEGMRKIPVQYAKRVAGNKMIGGQTSHIPLRINQAGVIPIIFAISLAVLPGTVSSYLINSPTAWIAQTAQFIQTYSSDTSPYFLIAYILLVLGFSFFYSSVSFNTTNISEQLQKDGGFVPGIRPGAPTQHHLQHILTRVTLIGGLFLAIMAGSPYIVKAIFPDIQSLALGGTSLLIVVAVTLETAKQVQAMLVMRSYEGFLR